MADRRRFLAATVGAGAAGTAALLGCRDRRRWSDRAVRKPERSPVAILAADRYDEARLAAELVRGLELFDLDVRGRRIVLKPNLVEFDPARVINTHPAVIGAAVEAFLRLGAGEVLVAEGPGHRRDDGYMLEASGLADRLRDAGVRYVDLNHDAVRLVPLASSFTGLRSLYLPETILGAGLLVSMPKLKTHHWAGVTLSMKNLFGIVPGALYGWPKNILHWAGIGSSILDINAALDVPRFNIVDGVVGMEGNGPIQGEGRAAGVLVLGADPVAVDGTCARVMGLEPWRVDYLARADAFMGNLGSDRIESRGEALSRHRVDFRVLERFENLRVASSVRGP